MTENEQKHQYKYFLICQQQSVRETYIVNLSNVFVFFVLLVA